MWQNDYIVSLLTYANWPSVRSQNYCTPTHSYARERQRGLRKRTAVSEWEILLLDTALMPCDGWFYSLGVNVIFLASWFSFFGVHLGFSHVRCRFGFTWGVTASNVAHGFSVTWCIVIWYQWVTYGQEEATANGWISADTKHDPPNAVACIAFAGELLIVLNKTLNWSYWSIAGTHEIHQI